MGIVSGAVRLRRYQVLGNVPPDFRDTFEEAIQRCAFADFGVEDQREQALGWAAVDDWYDSDLHLDRWLVENTVNLALRVDTRRIPAHYLKRECRRMEAEWKLKAGRENLSRAEREEIEELVTRRLLDRVIPSSQAYDFSWDLDRGDVLFWSTAEKANEAFRVLFEKTFGLKLQLLFPYTLARRVLGEDQSPSFEGTRPSAFARGGR